MGQIYGCTPENGVWVVPVPTSSARLISTVIAEAGTIYLPDAVPMVQAPGDVVISNRQLLHGSFANTSDQWRVTVNMGCPPRRRCSACVAAASLAEMTYDEAHIEKRSRAIAYAIAPAGKSTLMSSLRYEPLVGTSVGSDAREAHDYSVMDMSV